jgi:hypothetical protein
MALLPALTLHHMKGMDRKKEKKKPKKEKPKA